ncbi:MAG: dienelactone hydrolase family protein, partial [Gammaproteobacteria bacterium]|nr:dienelactone hydrolase family protein [Gammaproteobacteria bacterium]
MTGDSNQRASYRVETVSVTAPGVRHSPAQMPMLVFEPEGRGPHPGLIIAQHLPVAHAGLEKDPFQIETGRRYAAAGFVCAMPYLFHWWHPDAPVQTKRDEFRDDWTVLDLRASFDWLAGHAAVDVGRIGIVGHCFGGRVAWLGACHLPGLKACALFYGGRIKLSFADRAPAPIELAARIGCPVLGVFGNDDQNPTAEDVDDYEAALQAASVPHQFHRYEGA